VRCEGCGGLLQADALRNVDEIAGVADAVLIARGALGMEMSIEKASPAPKHPTPASRPSSHPRA
jgi:pyruvate kinase